MVLVIFINSGCKKELDASIPSESGFLYYDNSNTDKVNHVAKTSDGGFIYCGFTQNGLNHTDGFLMKVDKNGNQQWYKKYGGKNFDEFRFVMQTSEGGYLAVGITNSYGPVSNNDSVNKDFDYTVRMDANGETLWTNSYLNIQSALNAATETPDHRFVLVGSVSNPELNTLVLVINSSGQLQWGFGYKRLDQIPPFEVRSNHYHHMARTVNITDDGNILIGGLVSKSDLVIESRTFLPFLLKINILDGAPITVHPFYDIESQQDYRQLYMNIYGGGHRRYETMHILNQSDGYVVATYRYNGTSSNIEMVLFKTNIGGQLIWNKIYKGLGQALLNDITPLDDGNYLLIGASTNTVVDASYPELFANMKGMFLKVDKDGNELWTKYYGANWNAHKLFTIQKTSDNKWRTAGSSTMNENGFDKLFSFVTNTSGDIIVK